MFSNAVSMSKAVIGPILGNSAVMKIYLMSDLFAGWYREEDYRPLFKTMVLKCISLDF